jgi:hypothetical protein
MRRLRTASALLLAAGLAACGSSVMPAPLPAIEGRWQGTITSPADGFGTIALDLHQAGATVTGTVVLSQPGLPDAPGTFNGTVASAQGAATTLSYTTFYDYGDGCTGTYSGALDVGTTVLSGTYVGRNCSHPFTGSLRVTKTQ